MPVRAAVRRPYDPFCPGQDFPSGPKVGACGDGSEIAVARTRRFAFERQEAEFGPLMSGVGDGSGHRWVYAGPIVARHILPGSVSRQGNE